MILQVCQTETVYRYARINRTSAIYVLVNEIPSLIGSEYIDQRINDDEGLELYLAALSDENLVGLMKELIDEGCLADYFESEVIERDSSCEWDVEVCR